MSPSEQPSSIINVEQALTFTGGDVDMLLSVAELFADEGPKQLGELEKQIEATDAVGIARAAHLLKGSVVIFGASKAAAAALELEQVARGGHSDAIPAAWLALKREMNQLLSELKDLPNRLPTSEEGSTL